MQLTVVLNDNLRRNIFCNLLRLSLNFSNLLRLSLNFSRLNEDGQKAMIFVLNAFYLRQIYRFFGFWVIIVGLFIACLSTPQLSRIEIIRRRMLIVLALMMMIGTILGYALIPSSHFIYVIWIINILYFVCLYNHKKIENGT